MTKPTPIETLRQAVERAERYGPAYPKIADARAALAEVEAVVAFAKRVAYDEELSYLACPGPPNCGGHGAHYDTCPVALARVAAAPFTVKP